MKRRNFLRSVLGVGLASGAGAHFGAAAAAAQGSYQAADRVKIGPREIESSRLFLGTGSSGWGGSSDQTRGLGVSGLANFLADAFAEGITGWDSADQYGSHPHLAEALKHGVPRDKVTILTKTRARSATEMRADLDRFRRELGTDVIDILLLHCLTDPGWNRSMIPVMRVIDDAQSKGIVRSKGVSCHSLGALRSAASEPWVEIDLARINPGGAVMDADVETVVGVLREMKAVGKGVIAMKVFGAGQLASRADECLQFVSKLDCVDALTIGCRSDVERADLVRRMALV